MIPAALTVAAVAMCFVGREPSRSRRLASASPSRPRRRPRAWWIVVPVVVLLAGPAAGAIAGVTAAAVPRARRLADARARRRRIERELPDAIELLVLVVRAGMTPHEAIVVLASRSPDSLRAAFTAVQTRTERGLPLAEALDALPELLGPSASMLTDTLTLAERHGAPLGDALDQLSADVHERRRRSAEAEARKLPVRMSFPLVACTLPSFVLLAIVPAVLAALRSLDLGGL